MFSIAVVLRDTVVRRTHFCEDRRILKRFIRLVLLADMPHYAVARGRVPGVYPTWSECSAQVQSFNGARYKKFSTETEAREFINDNSDAAIASSSTPALSGTSSPNAAAIVALESVNSELSAVKANFASFVERTENALNSIGERIQTTMKSLGGGDWEALQDSKGGSGSDPQPPRKKPKRDVDLDPFPKDKDLDPLPKAEVDRLRTEGFVVDADGLVQVFTDGACSGNGYKGAKAGVGVWFNHGHASNVAAPVVGRPTNNCAEIEAAIAALYSARAAGVSKLCINTDSQFMINCVTKWIKGWKKNGWKTAQKEEVKNKEELIKLDSLLSKDSAITVQWNHVRGHRGIEGNEEADRLARLGAKEYQQKPGTSGFG